MFSGGLRVLVQEGFGDFCDIDLFNETIHIDLSEDLDVWIACESSYMINLSVLCAHLDSLTFLYCPCDGK